MNRNDEAEREKDQQLHCRKLAFFQPLTYYRSIAENNNAGSLDHAFIFICAKIVGSLHRLLQSFRFLCRYIMVFPI
jgi:hypothetical protein